LKERASLDYDAPYRYLGGCSHSRHVPAGSIAEEELAHRLIQLIAV
jgi:hypothetical protein